MSNVEIAAQLRKLMEAATIAPDLYNEDCAVVEFSCGIRLSSGVKLSMRGLTDTGSEPQLHCTHTGEK